MSIILALRSSRSVVVASDAQRVEADGHSTGPFDKTFAHGTGVVGAYAGLLEFHGASVGEHISGLRALGTEPRRVVEEIAALIHPLMVSIPCEEVGLQYRRLDVIVGCLAGLASVGFFPEPDSGLINVRFNASDSFLVTGDPAAHGRAQRVLDGQRRVLGLRPSRLRAFAVETVEQSIAACGPHPYAPTLPSCCDPVYLRQIPAGEVA